MAIIVELTEGERRITVSALNRAKNISIEKHKGDAHKEEALKNQYNKIIDKFRISD